MKKWLLLPLLLALLTLAGCGLVDKLQLWKNGTGEQVSVVEIDLDAKEEAEEGTEAAPEEKAAETTAGPKETTSLWLYFIDEASGELAAEEVTVEKVTGIARQAAELLIAGPEKADDRFTPIPEGTRLLDINVREDGVCVVDFSSELAEGQSSRNTEEQTVESIVYTLTQFASVDSVQILVSGRQRQTLAGNVDISAPLSR